MCVGDADVYLRVFTDNDPVVEHLGCGDALQVKGASPDIVVRGAVVLVFDSQHKVRVHVVFNACANLNVSFQVGLRESRITFVFCSADFDIPGHATTT